MSDSLNHGSNLSTEQQAIQHKHSDSSATFVQFSKEESEQSIPARFEKIVQRYPQRLAVKMGDRELSYDELNRYANRIARGDSAKARAGQRAHRASICT